jgi:hypothetical protein
MKVSTSGARAGWEWASQVVYTELNKVEHALRRQACQVQRLIYRAQMGCHFLSRELGVVH